MLRKILFWTHLACGVAAGLVILMMSVTGVVLTYERQMLDWAERSMHATPPPDAEPRPLLALVAAVRQHDPGFAATSVTVENDPTAPATVGAGRAGSLYVDRYTGRVLGEGAEGVREFFGAMTGWHRWFNASGESRGVARAITGASNLAFLFLILSGMYLWLPRVYKWAAFRTRLFFNAKATGGKARDFNWHHVFGIWSAVPLAIVVATAAVFSYGWANDLVYRSFGEEPPARGRGRGGPPPGEGSDGEGAIGEAIVEQRLSLDDLLALAAMHVEDWNRITVQLPPDDATEVGFTIDQGNGGQPQHRHTLVLDGATGKVEEWQPFDSQTPGRRARSIVRFLHTGEVLGIAGQTIAGLVSLTSVIMVWTGLALAWRRLIVPLFASRRNANLEA
ncbi:MAG: PepSY domain-containing protein [Gammaproteobacteria bacterium]|nr:PepSY domain-containing protein [Gammaproteobacteria bacterium]